MRPQNEWSLVSEGHVTAQNLDRTRVLCVTTLGKLTDITKKELRDPVHETFRLSTARHDHDNNKLLRDNDLPEENRKGPD